MSATPIPRSIALTIYGDGTDVYQITEKPAGRIPVKTYFDNGGRVKNFIYARLKEGGQAYVICPLKEEAEEGSVMENILSAEEAYKEYDSLFGKLGYRSFFLNLKKERNLVEESIQKLQIKNELWINLKTEKSIF